VLADHGVGGRTGSTSSHTMGVRSPAWRIRVVLAVACAQPALNSRPALVVAGRGPSAPCSSSSAGTG
jgi:hypothetical protein